MSTIPEYRTIYKAILECLDKEPTSRQALIDYVVGTFRLSDSELSDTSTNSKKNVIRSLSGIIINEMHTRGLIIHNEGIYYRNPERPVIVRIEHCEEEILRLITKSPMTKRAIRDEMVKILGTDKTATTKDDNKLMSYIGQVLKSLVNEKMINYDGSVYSIAPSRMAEIKSREEIASLKADFLALIHSRGGEFFEHYFMNLLARYLIRSGKTVLESRVTGGASDGGIDGIIKTVDTLGFKEVIMVQCKNRLDVVSETDVRGFYGAVCALQGSRGIYATTSTFHPVADEFLSNLDNCVGLDGNKIFAIATDTSYGIKREDERLVIDRAVIY